MELESSTLFEIQSAFVDSHSVDVLMAEDEVPESVEGPVVHSMASEEAPQSVFETKEAFMGYFSCADKAWQLAAVSKFMLENQSDNQFTSRTSGSHVTWWPGSHVTMAVNTCSFFK